MSVTDRNSGLLPYSILPDDDALFCLGSWLQHIHYRFVTVTPATHARVNARPGSREAKTLQDIFGWSRPFQASLLPERVLRWLEQGDCLEYTSGLLRSKIRFSTLGDSLYMHSAWPTRDPDAVFFGPDTYRFAALIQRTLATAGVPHPDCVVDVGCGTGAGGIVAMQSLKQGPPSQLVLTDINPEALRYARVNAALAEIPDTSFCQGDLLSMINHPIGLLVANPPYLLDAEARVYRHGGGELGSALSTRIVAEGLPRLAPGGILILYTGTPVVDGKDTFWESIAEVVQAADVYYEYTELDPDVFGDELEFPAYASVDRIAAVALVIRTSQPATKKAMERHKPRRVPEIMLNEPRWHPGR